jgi:hypothetical protein
MRGLVPKRNWLGQKLPYERDLNKCERGVSLIDLKINEKRLNSTANLLTNDKRDQEDKQSQNS